jgi:hypothetical protein
MTHFPPLQSPRPVERSDVNPIQRESSPTQRAKRTLSAQPKPSPRLVPRIQLTPRTDATKVEVASSLASTSPHEEPITARLTLRSGVTPRAEAEKCESSPQKKSKKHTRNNTYDTPVQLPALKAPRTRRSAGDKERRELKPELKKTSPRLLKPRAPTTMSQPVDYSPRTPKDLGQSGSATSSPRFVVSQRGSPKSPRFVIGLKQQPSAPLSASKADQPREGPSQLGQSTPEKSTNVQQRKAFFEGLTQSANQLPPARNAANPLVRSATAQSGSGRVSKLVQSAGHTKMRSTKPDFHS